MQNMSRPEDEYVSPWQDLEPSDPVAKERASRAFTRLATTLFPEDNQFNPQQEMFAFSRLMTTLGTYFTYSVRAASEQLTGDERTTFIMDGLKQDALIDPEDPQKAAYQYEIISEGYELNRPYWDRMLGGMRNSRNRQREKFDI